MFVIYNNLDKNTYDGINLNLVKDIKIRKVEYRDEVKLGVYFDNTKVEEIGKDDIKYEIEKILKKDYNDKINNIFYNNKIFEQRSLESVREKGYLEFIKYINNNKLKLIDKVFNELYSKGGVYYLAQISRYKSSYSIIIRKMREDIIFTVLLDINIRMNMI